jgi:hypothetical protein
LGNAKGLPDAEEDGTQSATSKYCTAEGALLELQEVNVYEFDIDSGNWTLLASKITGVEGELSGTSVALSADGNRVAISSPVFADADLGTEVGATRVYDLC